MRGTREVSQDSKIREVLVRTLIMKEEEGSRRTFFAFDQRIKKTERRRERYQHQANQDTSKKIKEEKRVVGESLRLPTSPRGEGGSKRVNQGAY